VTVDAEETDLLTESLRELFAEDAADVAERLRELGWDDVGAWDPAAATTLLFTEKGRALSNAALLDAVVLPLVTAGLPADLPGGPLGGAVRNMTWFRDTPAYIADGRVLSHGQRHRGTCS
jgi:hypothetical protein